MVVWSLLTSGGRDRLDRQGPHAVDEKGGAGPCQRVNPAWRGAVARVLFAHRDAPVSHDQFKQRGQIRWTDNRGPVTLARLCQRPGHPQSSSSSQALVRLVLKRLAALVKLGRVWTDRIGKGAS
jgi:hypothetical protein